MQDCNSRFSANMRKTYLTIFWVSAAIFSGGSTQSPKPVDLTIIPHWLQNCEDPIVLECRISSAERYKVIAMEWFKFCNHSTLGRQCTYKENEGLHLTIPSCTTNLKDKQEYMCTLQTDKGHAIKSTTMMVGDCRNISLVSVLTTQMQCIFCVSDANSQVHWFHGNNNNVTSNATDIRQWKTPDGHFKISSVLPIREGSDQYRCTLWLPSKMANSANSKLLNRVLWLLILLSFI